jgi:ABC-type transport system involved in multi-copper enzyme maturation permease subunit
MNDQERQADVIVTVARAEAEQTAQHYQSMPLTRIRAIALNTFRETVRDRILYNLVLFVLILVAASVFVSELSISTEAKFIADLGMSSTLVFGTIIAIFIGVGLVYKEMEKRTIYNLLSKPVHRHEFIIGKYLGLSLTLLLNSGLMTLGTILALTYVNRGFTHLQLAIIPAALLIFLELEVVVAVALLFSSFTTPLLATLFSIATFIIGHFSSDLRLAASLSKSMVIKAILGALYYLLPNLANFGYITQASYGRVVPVNAALGAVAYAVIYTSVLLASASMIFQARNFK